LLNLSTNSGDIRPAKTVTKRGHRAREEQLSRRFAAVRATVFLAAGVIPCALAAQSASDRAAWNALILSPIGALAPLARDAGDDGSESNVWLRYGRWRYDVDDAIHNNTGVTVFRELPFASSELSITGAYLSLSCAACPSWVSGGVGLQSSLWQHGSREEGSASVGLRTDVGGAHYRGESQTSAASAASALIVSVGRPFFRESHLSATVSPGFGMGRIALIDGIHNGARPTLGAALAWTFKSGLALNIGMQRIVIAGGPTQLGAGLGWSRQ
jgi:hypothetical protein